MLLVRICYSSLILNQNPWTVEFKFLLNLIWLLVKLWFCPNLWESDQDVC